MRRLEDRGRYFEILRRTRTESSDQSYFSAILASRFGEEAKAISLLKSWLSSSALKTADRVTQRRAHEEIAYACLRTGKYDDAASELDLALRLVRRGSSEHAALENTRLLAESLRGVEPQSVRFEQPSSSVQAVWNAGGSWDVPVEVNGRASTAVFDTGANLSAITESEASRMGLEVRETRATVKGSTGKRNAMKVAVADHLRFESAHFRNVVLIVLPDAALRFPEIGLQIRGFLGLPVIRALECVGISEHGVARMGNDVCLNPNLPNLFFEDLGLIVESAYREHRLQWLLDSGANESNLYSSSRAALGATPLTESSEQTGGAGRVVRRKVYSVPALQFSLGGRSLTLREITLYRTTPSRCRDGLLGMDVLRGGFSLDFKTMQLRLD